MSDKQEQMPNQLIVEPTETTLNGLDQLIKDSKDGEWIAWAYKFENARRLVACWNACEGVPSEVLEDVNSSERELLHHYVALLSQRAALVEALKELRDAVKAEPAMNNMKYDALGVKVNKAIAKAEGKE